MNILYMLNLQMPPKAYIYTYGCQMNMHDSEKMAGILAGEGYGLAETPQKADLIIFNTCSIREKAEQKFRSTLGRITKLKRKNKPLIKIAIAGCIAQQYGSKILLKHPHIDYVLGPQNILQLKNMIKADKPMVSIDDNPELENTDLPLLRKDTIKTWVSIMHGCDNYCSYCIVPYTRGRERSRSSENICSEISELALNGFKEVTLLGQNVNSYGSDIDFVDLLRKVHAVKGIERIRFVTSHPRDLSESLMDCIKELTKVCEHIHLPLQSGSSRILKLMNRGYGYEDYIKKIENLRIRIPDIAITTDIIAGFPSETDKDHNLTIEALSTIGFDGVFAFYFSPRPGTAASKMDKQVPDEIKSKRLTEILNFQDNITSMKNKAFEGSIQEILVEGISKTDKDKITGRTRTNKIVNFKGEDSIFGKLVNVAITKALRHSLEGKIIG